MRKKRRCRAGLPDLLILFRGQLIAVELKSRGGRCSAAQRLTREALIAAGGAWWEARSANAAMWALAECGVTFRDRPPLRHRMLETARASAVGSAATGPSRAATRRAGDGGAATDGTAPVAGAAKGCANDRAIGGG
jgi:hypothetical protein